MKTKSKIWLGVGAFVIAGSGAISAAVPPAAEAPVSGMRAGGPASNAAIAQATGAAEYPGHTVPDGEGGEAGALTKLPPDLAFAVRIALIRGHLLVGDELVKQQQWNAALPHFLHPTEEIYGDIKDQLAAYNAPQFDAALKALADLVKAKKGGADYAKARKPVDDALASAELGMKGKHADWPAFVTETAVEAAKTAAGEYEGAIVNGKLAKPVEYQDARGFIWQADRMIESVAADLQKKDAGALKKIRADFSELKKVFPAAMPPRTPVKDHAAMLAIVSRIELAAGKLM